MPSQLLSTELITLRDYLRWALTRFNQAQLFYGQGNDNAWDEALHLVFGGLNLPLDADQRLLDARLTQAEKLHLLNLIEQRATQRQPLAYLLGEAWFAGLRFIIDERVLIPRSPIAELILNGYEPWFDTYTQPERILDLCTGSGCIGIASAYAFPTAEVVLSDLSSDALAVAQQNIQLHGLESRVSAIQSDLFAQLPTTQKFDLIVSNPPYVDAQDLANMPAEFHHEPELALASGADGLDITRTILAQAANYLTPNGLLIVEVGNSQVHLEELFPQVPFLWLEFEANAGGVFALTQEQLLAAQTEFAAALK